MAKRRILFSFPVYISFIKKDESLLKEHFEVLPFHFDQYRKWLIPFELFRHFFKAWRSRKYIDAYVSFFAGYSSFVPSLLSWWENKPHILVLGGTDCIAIPEIRYGNFQKKILGWFTCYSLRHATYLLPVSQNLIEQEYTYFDTKIRKQGFKAFCPSVSAPVQVIPIGQDSTLFYTTAKKRPRSFLTVAQLNESNFYRKGVDLIFQLADIFTDCSFTIIGNNSSMKYEYIPSNVTLLSFVPHNELRVYYSDHQFYCQLSMMEGFPSALCEAMLCECIPIVSAVGAMPEIVGGCGFMLEKKSVKELKELVITALSCDLTKYGRQARERIIENFPLDIRRKLVDIVNAEISSVKF